MRQSKIPNKKLKMFLAVAMYLSQSN
jgi:hypothetical protein